MVYKIKGANTELIPGQRFYGNQVFLDLSQGVVEPGFYQLERGDNDILSKYAFNYLRSESSQKFLEDKELENMIPGAKILTAEISTPLTSMIKQESKVIPLWKWFLFL